MDKKFFRPRPGQVDYTEVRFAPVINCVVQCNGEILLVRRSSLLNFYPGYWNGISGFLDDQKTIEQKVYEELNEEAGIPRSRVVSLKFGAIFHQEEPKYKKTWIVHPVLARVKTDAVRLDWEGQEYQWVKPENIQRFKLLPGFERVVQSLPLSDVNMSG